MPDLSQLAELAGRKLLERNFVYEQFFERQATQLALACQLMADRFLDGGRLLAAGRGAYATDAQHVSVEFVHPVIVGKRALPALDVSALTAEGLKNLARPRDIVMGFGPPGGDIEVERMLEAARARGAMTFALPGRHADYAVPCFSADPFQHQEMIEILYHTLWETVHVFFEHRELASEAGDAGFLYPFLGSAANQTAGALEEVAASIRMKVADDSRLRARAAAGESQTMAGAAAALNECVRGGGQIFLFGNGGSATDANDWAFDCVCPPAGMRPVPAISLSADPAVLSALANDVGAEVIFLRQLIAQARPGDAVVGISTSGGSRNILATFEEARKRKLATVALLGYDGGEVVRRGLADYAVVVRSDYIPRIQEVQASMYHTIRELMEEEAAHA